MFGSILYIFIFACVREWQKNCDSCRLWDESSSMSDIREPKSNKLVIKKAFKKFRFSLQMA
jgi:hypothetical protein